MSTNNVPRSAMYGFLGCTARQFMTRTVVTVRRHMTMRELAELFEKHDFLIEMGIEASGPLKGANVELIRIFDGNLGLVGNWLGHG